MRIQIITLLAFFCSFSVFANEEKLNELFKKYDAVVKYHEVEHVEEVFSKKFITEAGGKDEFIEKIKENPKQKKPGKLKKLLQSWKKGKVGKVIFAKVKDDSGKHQTQFIIIEEDGKLKIDGTLSDDH